MKNNEQRWTEQWFVTLVLKCPKLGKWNAKCSNIFFKCISQTNNAMKTFKFIISLSSAHWSQINPANESFHTPFKKSEKITENHRCQSLRTKKEVMSPILQISGLKPLAKLSIFDKNEIDKCQYFELCSSHISIRIFHLKQQFSAFPSLYRHLQSIAQFIFINWSNR